MNISSLDRDRESALGFRKTSLEGAAGRQVELINDAFDTLPLRSHSVKKRSSVIRQARNYFARARRSVALPRRSSKFEHLASLETVQHESILLIEGRGGASSHCWQ